MLETVPDAQRYNDLFGAVYLLFHRRDGKHQHRRPHRGHLREGTTMTTTSCESCGMPIESGPYCAHCVDADGMLQAFDERFERMVGWQARRHPEQSRAEVEAATLEYMATMPAWRDHPRVMAARG